MEKVVYIHVAVCCAVQLVFYLEGSSAALVIRVWLLVQGNLLLLDTLLRLHLLETHGRLGLWVEPIQLQVVLMLRVCSVARLLCRGEVARLARKQRRVVVLWRS